MKKFLFAALIAGAMSALSFVAPASAQATRTWVSGVGDDANPCSRTAPCKTFPGAYSKTAIGGEINCLDSGGFGTITISHSINIKCQGVIGGILSAGTVGVTVNLPAGSKVVLDGLDIEGVGTGTTGVRSIGSGSLTITNTVIRDHTGNGVDCIGTAGGRCAILNSQILNNGGGGFNVGASGGAQMGGVSIGTIYDNNPSFGMQATAPSVLTIGNNTTLGTATGLSNVGGATINSFVDNEINAGATPTTNIPRR